MKSRDQLTSGCQTLGIDLDPRGLERLLRYCAELVKWNRRFNLVARGTDEATLLEKHFLDSLTILPLLHERDILLDVGSGAGFPGLVLAASRPVMPVTLVEPREKRVSFLRHVVRTLGLNQVTVVMDRLENFVPAAPPTCITGRAVADPTAFLELVSPILSQTGRIILMGAQVDRLADAAAGAGLHIIDQRQLQLPISGADRVLVVARR